MTQTTITGTEFNEKYKNYEFYILLTENLIHNGHTCTQGLQTYKQTKECTNEGMEFIEKNKIPMWIDEHYYITTVKVWDDSIVCIENNKFKSNLLVIYLDEKVEISDFKLWNDYEFCKMAVQQNGLSLKYVKEQTEELCKLAVQQNVESLQYVKEQTEELYKFAVQQNGYVLQYVKEQTEELCKIAVQQNGYALRYVNEQTELICKLAVNQEGNALQYVKEQTDEICKLAIEQKCNSLKYVNNQTDEICKIAIQKHPYCFCFVKKPTMYLFKLVLQRHGYFLQFFNEQTEELCKLAVQQNGYAIKFVKDQTEEICKLAVQQNGWAIKFVKNQTEEICKLATEQKKKFDVVVYHGGCSDGIGGLWCSNHYKPIERIYGCVAGKNPIGDFKNMNVLFVDICPTFDYLIELSQIANQVVVLDHHKSSYEMIQKNTHNLSSIDNLVIEFDMERSGCQMAWDYFFENQHRPFFIDYIGDRDLWTWKLPSSKEINNALFELGYIDSNDLSKMTKLLENPNVEMEKLKQIGELIENMNKKQIDKCLNNAIEGKMTVNDKTYRVWLAGNINQNLKSDLGNLLCSKEFTDGTLPDFSVCWQYDPKSDEWWLSLRGDKSRSPDLSIITSSFGGGGHPMASGMSIKSNSKGLKQLFTY